MWRMRFTGNLSHEPACMQTVSGIDRSTYCATTSGSRNSLGMTATERRKYEQSVSSSTQDGRFELYKTRGDHERNYDGSSTATVRQKNWLAEVSAVQE